MDLENKIEESFLSLKEGDIYKAIIDDTEKILIDKALRRTHGNQITAARILGLNRNTLRAKIRKLNIKPSLYRDYM